MTTGGKIAGGTMLTRLLAVLLGLIVASTACTGSATVTQIDSASSGGQAEPTAVESPVAEVVEVVEPDSTALPTGTDVSTPVPLATQTPVGPPPVQLSTDAFRTDALLRLSNDGAFAYAGTSSVWADPTSCDSAPAESLAVVDVAAAATGDVTVVAAGLEQVGDVRELAFNDLGSAAILSSCGPSFVDNELWLQRAEVAADGRIVSVSDPIVLNANGETGARLLEWIDDDLVQVVLTIQVDPDDSATWIIEQRQLSISTGQVVSSEERDFYVDTDFDSRPALTTDQGFTYRVVEDPAGNAGCEGFGSAVTLELDDDEGWRPALTQTQLVFSDVYELHTSPAGYIAWASRCEGFASAFVGRVLDDGTIADAHLIDTFSFSPDSYSDFQAYRLSSDGFLHGVGQRFEADADQATLAVLRYDLSADPHFVNTADPAPQIDEQPIASALEDGVTWHVGNTLGSEPACGGRTLYGQNSGGFFRAFTAGFEIDTIVDVDFSETNRVSYSDGDFVSRTLVVQTECPGSYEGRRVWFGLETESSFWGLALDRADLGEVADVLAVSDVFEDGTDFVEATIVQVELLNGSVVEVELVRLPADS